MIIFEKHKTPILPVLFLIMIFFTVLMMGNVPDESDFIVNGRVVAENVPWVGKSILVLFLVILFSLLYNLYIPTVIAYSDSERKLHVKRHDFFLHEKVDVVEMYHLSSLNLYEDERLSPKVGHWHRVTDFIIYAVTDDDRLIKLTSCSSFNQFERFLNFILKIKSPETKVFDLNEYKTVESASYYESNYKYYIGLLNK